jgi:hypothetical protein
MHQVGFEPTIAVFEWAKAVHALDRVGTVIGTTNTTAYQIVEVIAFM